MRTECEAKNLSVKETRQMYTSLKFIDFYLEGQVGRVFRASVQLLLVVLHLQEPPHLLQQSHMRHMPHEMTTTVTMNCVDSRSFKDNTGA